MFAREEYKDAARLLVVMLNAKIVPRWWWGVILLDAGGMLDGEWTSAYRAILSTGVLISSRTDSEMVFSHDDAYELLRYLEEIYTRAEQGAGAEYLGALDRIMRGNATNPDGNAVDNSKTKVDIESTLGQLQVVRLALARYLARCSVGVSRLY